MRSGPRTVTTIKRQRYSFRWIRHHPLRVTITVAVTIFTVVLVSMACCNYIRCNAVLGHLVPVGPQLLATLPDIYRLERNQRIHFQDLNKNH